MGSMFPAELAVFPQLQTVRIIASVLDTAIVPVLALGTLYCNDYPDAVTPPDLVSYL